MREGGPCVHSTHLCNEETQLCLLPCPGLGSPGQKGGTEDSRNRTCSADIPLFQRQKALGRTNLLRTKSWQGQGRTKQESSGAVLNLSMKTHLTLTLPHPYMVSLPRKGSGGLRRSVSTSTIPCPHSHRCLCLHSSFNRTNTTYMELSEAPCSFSCWLASCPFSSCRSEF